LLAHLNDTPQTADFPAVSDGSADTRDTALLLICIRDFDKHIVTESFSMEAMECTAAVEGRYEML
jgi:hypothetical protein